MLLGQWEQKVEKININRQVHSCLEQFQQRFAQGDWSGKDWSRLRYEGSDFIRGSKSGSL